MAKKPAGTSKTGAKSGKLGVKSETFKKFTDKQLDNVKGGRPMANLRAAGTTLNPTSSDGCCGA